MGDVVGRAVGLALPGSMVLPWAVGDVAGRVVDLARASGRPYAVFVGRSVELMPADGPRFLRLQADPLRMAQCVGVFGCDSSAADVCAALLSFGGK